MSRVRKPAEGDRVMVVDHWTETTIFGVVDILLSSQFAIDAEDGHRYIIPYNGDWIHANETDPE